MSYSSDVVPSAIGLTHGEAFADQQLNLAKEQDGLGPGETISR